MTHPHPYGQPYIAAASLRAAAYRPEHFGRALIASMNDSPDEIQPITQPGKRPAKALRAGTEERT